MANLDELKAERLRKLNLLVKNNINPFKNRGNPTINNREFLALDWSTTSAGVEAASKPETFVLVGRIMNMRSFGALTFFKLYDGYDTVQIVVEVAHDNGEYCLQFIDQYLDSGDFVEVTGVKYITKKGEKSLLINNIDILTKSLLPLPDKWSGLEDEDLRLRLRYMDILTNTELREMIEKKARFYKVIREFLESRNFIAVDTPTLEVTTGGAEAAPFATYHNDYDLDVYMRISIGELWQKRLMAAGLPRTYEIGRAYRNEGSSPNHLQEFTNCEFYMAYADYRDGMQLVKELYREIATKTFGKTEFSTREHTFDLAHEWTEINYGDEIKRQTGVDIYNIDIAGLKSKLAELKVKSDGVTRERLIDSLWKYCRKSIAGPAFVINYPDFMQPLAKRSSENSNVVEQFQVLLGGAEIGKGYSELNDPIDQRERFDHQQSMRAAGDMEAMMPDYDFVEMLEHGMPPTLGFGFGERLFAFLVDKPIREVQIFPLMKPVSAPSPLRGASQKEAGNSKDKETKVATIIIDKSFEMEKWQEMNTVAHLSAEFVAHHDGDLLFADKIKTKDNQDINLNIKHAILIKETDTKLNNYLLDIYRLNSELNNGEPIEVAVFTREMLSTTNDKKVVAMTSEKDFGDIEILGILLFGNKVKVDDLTKSFELYK